MKYGIVMTGGVAKGAFQAGVLKSFAEKETSPTVVVGASSGALNGCMLSRLIVEDKFNVSGVEEDMIDVWVNQASATNLWSIKGEENNKDSIRNVFYDLPKNPFMLLKRISDMRNDVWSKLREFLTFSFLSIFDKQSLPSLLKTIIPLPESIKKDLIFSVSVTDLCARSEFIEGVPINNYGDYLTYKFEKGKSENIKEDFEKLIQISAASASFPIMFSPVELDINNKGKKRYMDGGLTKNAPFGRAIKLDPEIEKIFLISPSPISRPIIGDIYNFPSLVGQVYEIIITKDIANDYRKVQQINNKIKTLQDILIRDSENEVIDNQENNNMCILAGFKGVIDFLQKRRVEIVIIEPQETLEGDPFSGLYSRERKRIMQDYVKHGYKVGSKILKKYDF